MDKYYVPELEEFHVGFEYEAQDMTPCGSSVDWFKYVFEINDSLELLFKPNDWYELPRVKYLDKEDIESLGFKQGELPYQYFKDTYMLVDLVGNNKYLINQPNLYEDSEFRGTIKNKSELKKLLKQLDIL